MTDPYPPLLVRAQQHVPHIFKTVALLLLSFAFLQYDFVILVNNLLPQILAWLYPQASELPSPIARRFRIRRANIFEPKTILITGASTSRGLSLARHFYAAGHDVIAADCEHNWLPISPARVSRAVSKYARLPNLGHGHDALLRYAEAVTRIVQQHNVDLFLPCEAETAEEHMANALTKELLIRRFGKRCASVQLDMSMTERLLDSESLREYTKNLDLPMLERVVVTSVDAALEVLEESPRRVRYTLEQGNETSGLHIDPSATARTTTPTLLPLKSPEQTKSYLAQFSITASTPYVLQQHISGPTFSAHALIARGRVKHFVALDSSSSAQRLKCLSETSGLHLSMLRYTQEFASASQQVLRSSWSNFTGHISFTFAVDREDTEAALLSPDKIVRLYATTCTPGATNALVLFDGMDGVAENYLQVLESEKRSSSQASSPGTSGLANTPLSPLVAHDKYRWLTHDLVTMVAVPLLALVNPIKYRTKVMNLVDSILDFVAMYRAGWRDVGAFVAWDPVPSFWLYHVYFPIRFYGALLTKRHWESIDVSTCRIYDMVKE